MTADAITSPADAFDKGIALQRKQHGFCRPAFDYEGQPQRAVAAVYVSRRGYISRRFFQVIDGRLSDYLNADTERVKWILDAIGGAESCAD